MDFPGRSRDTRRTLVWIFLVGHDFPFFLFFDKKLSIVIITSTMVKKHQNVYESMHSGQRDPKLVQIG